MYFSAPTHCFFRLRSLSSGIEVIVMRWKSRCTIYANFEGQRVPPNFWKGDNTLKQQPTKLALHQETLQNLTPSASSTDPVSPLCGPTYWETCDTNTAAQ